MSQNTFPSTSPTGLSSGSPWISETTLRHCLPWFRAVLDCLLITFGAFLAAVTFSVVGSTLKRTLECGNWQLVAYLCGQLTLGVAGVLVVYFTARSNYWQVRERVQICLSIVLLVISGFSLVSLMMRSPELAYQLQMLIVGLAILPLVCVGMIAVEKRLLSGGGADAVERTASVRQTFGRIFWAGMAFIISLDCVYSPLHIGHSVFSGSLWDAFQAEFDSPLNFINYLSLLLLVVGSKLFLISIIYPAWSGLVDFHRPKFRSYKERFKGQASPVSVAALVFSIGSIASLVLLAQLQSVYVGPWALLVVSIVSSWMYRKTRKMKAKPGAAAFVSG